jgi:hypothetical protein
LRSAPVLCVRCAIDHKLGLAKTREVFETAGRIVGMLYLVREASIGFDDGHCFGGNIRGRIFAVEVDEGSDCDCSVTYPYPCQSLHAHSGGKHSHTLVVVIWVALRWTGNYCARSSIRSVHSARCNIPQQLVQGSLLFLFQPPKQ